MSQTAKSRGPAEVFEIWNRKLHYYVGLYFLFFIWLFSFTGLLLNHSWKFAEFWPNRSVSTLERSIVPPTPTGDLQQAMDMMRQLGIDGEVEWTGTQKDSASLSFRVSRPGRTTDIKADLARGTAQNPQEDEFVRAAAEFTLPISSTGGYPNNRLYSRLNCEALS